MPRAGRVVAMSKPPRCLKVLIIEDEEDTAVSLARLMSLGGHDVTVARSGPEGVKLAIETRPEVILLDLGMPKMDGYQVASRLRATGDFDDVLIVALSGHGMASDRARSAASGIDHHLVKPTVPTDLETLITAGERESQRLAP
jgi:CheY-like chemotaxis protein